MKNLLKVLVVAFASMSFASANVFNLSLTPDIAIKDRTDKIEGFSLGIWNENPMEGFSLGIVNGSTGHSKGFSWAFIANYAEDFTGGHLAIVNYSKGHFTGAQVGGGNYAKKLTGLQFGFVNYAESVDNGIQIGLINIIPETTSWFTGFPNELTPFFPFVNWRFE